MKRSIRALALASPWSGSGKTVISCGLLRCLREVGLKPAPFKVGPDYIDPSLLEKAAGAPCFNLDVWLCGEEGIKRSFARGTRKRDFALVEGVMGVFDGIGGTSKGSTAHVCKLLGIPVVMVFPAKNLGNSIRALLEGIVGHDPELEVSGVILNGVASVRHERILVSSVEGLLPVLGVVPKTERLVLSSRHLGLFTGAEVSEEFYQKAESVIKEHTDLDHLIKVSREVEVKPPPEDLPKKAKKTVAVAFDEAFSFYYRENFEVMRERGIKPVFFSPLREELPSSVEGLYIGGGYPELFLERLSERRNLFREVKRLVKDGFPVLAECGGFMFLSKGITYRGKTFPMCGALDFHIEVTERLQSIGYRSVRITGRSRFCREGSFLKGHEFRYSRADGFTKGFEVFDAFGVRVSSSGVVEGNVVASYIHFHFGGKETLVDGF